MRTPTRVVLADDHPMLRRGLRETLVDAGILVVAEAGSGPDALAAIRAIYAADGAVDVLVTDLTMPEFGGLELLSRVHAEIPTVAVMILSVHPELEVARTAFKAGALGYVEKRVAADCLVEAVERVAAGERYMSGELGAHLAEVALVGDPTTALSLRELQVVRAVADGATRDEIARALGVTPATVTTFKRRAAGKLNVRTDAEMARYAIAFGLVEPPLPPHDV